MRGVFLHALADSLGSLGVIISTVLVKYHGITVADPICSFIIAAMILMSGIPFIKSTARQLLLECPSGLQRKVREARSQILQLESGGIVECNIRSWRLKKGKDQVTCHVKVLSHHNQIEEIEAVL